MNEGHGKPSPAHAAGGAEGSSVSTDRDSVIEIEAASYSHEEEDTSSLDGAPQHPGGLHFAKTGVRSAAAAAADVDYSDSDYHPPGKQDGGAGSSPRRSLRYGRGQRPTQAYPRLAKARAGCPVPAGEPALGVYSAWRVYTCVRRNGSGRHLRGIPERLDE